MKKSFKVILGLIFVFNVVHNYAQNKSQKSKVIISEAEIISLSNTLKKYSNTKNLEVNNPTKKELDSLNHRINQLTELLALQKEVSLSLKEEPQKIVTASVKNTDVVEKPLISAEEQEPIKNIDSDSINENVLKKENEINAFELTKLEQEVADLKILVTEILDNQIKTSNSQVQTKEIETIIQPSPVIIEKTISKTDTVYVLTGKDSAKNVDSLNMKLLAVKNEELLRQQLIIDSLRNQLFKKNLDTQKKLEKKVEITTSKLYFNNNEFRLNEMNTIILDEILSSRLEVKGKFKFYIKGFASNSGNANYNKILSTKRSQAVYHYLVLKGIEAEAIKSESFGADYIEKNESKARRVEIAITSDVK
jgi:outer membrane protein OmpA-like peptidoglycan-associated protein